jgi:hypothetical protein
LDDNRLAQEKSGLDVKDWSGTDGIRELGKGEPSFDLGCGPVDSAELDG